MRRKTTLTRVYNDNLLELKKNFGDMKSADRIDKMCRVTMPLIKIDEWLSQPFMKKPKRKKE